MPKINNKYELIFGILLCLVISLLSIYLSKYIPIGSVAIAIIIGIILGNSINLNKKFNSGISFSEKHILSIAIALLGVKLDFSIVKQLGLTSVLIVILGIVITLLSSLFFGKIFKFEKKFALLIGIGNGVCGSSAIAATEGIIGVEKEEVGLSVAVVNFLGTIGIFLLPFIGIYVLKFNSLSSGLLIGNTLQAVGQVVAAAFSINEVTGQTATIVKMTRILMLTPIIFVLIFVFSKSNKGDLNKKIKIPAFIVGFIIFSLVSTFKLLPNIYLKFIGNISHYALIIAMAGIGLKITFSSILKKGLKALLIGSAIFLTQIIVSGILVKFFY